MESPPVTPEESHIVAHRSSSFTALRSLNKTLKAQRLSASNASPAPTRSSSMNNDKRSLPGKRKAMMVLFLAVVSISTIFVVKDLRFSGQPQQPQVDATKRVGVLDEAGRLMAVDSPPPAQSDGGDSLTGTGTANSESDIERLPSASDQSRVLTDGSQSEQRPSFHTSVQNGFGHSPPAGDGEGDEEFAPDALGGENAVGRQNELGGQEALRGEDASRGQDSLEGQGALGGQDASKEGGVEIETEARVYELREKKRKKKRRKEKKVKKEKRPKKGRRGMGVRAPALPPPPSPPPPPAQINPLDPVLPPSHPCANFTLPPPSTDRKRTGPRPCPVCYLPLPGAMGIRPPRGHTEEPILKHLAYVTEDDASERAARRAGNRPRFNGHQSLQQREDSFKIQESMRVHCGFVWGGKVGNGTGFDVSDDDRRFMERCYDIVVVSAIFGAYDVVQQPSNVSEEARQQLCFVMFVDHTTFTEFIRDGTLKQPRTRRVGLWRLVVVHNPPYRDPRRTGKIPKLLIHRLFPNVQFSMWVDAKLQLVQDPYMILERFLWRGNFSWAISKHYKRFDVFVEAEANKAAGKYRNASIDEQMEVYRSDGMTPFSEDKMPIISDVPEGCVIMREHTALSNLMACLWFNEVDRFTSRDQLSFGYTRDKICRSVPAWRLNMFLDCERRNFVVQVGALRCRSVLCGTGQCSAVQGSALRFRAVLCGSRCANLHGSSTAPALALPTGAVPPSPLQGYHKDVLIQKLDGSPCSSLMLSHTLPPLPPSHPLPSPYRAITRTC
ncbi:unnamed protein product [Closterium sp. Naga37s-1]|nr:unnamed protein product [Closterium sp. Naga37s-1]